MTSSRAAILGKVRQALGRNQGDPVPPPPLPAAIATGDGADLAQRLAERLTLTGVSLQTLASLDELAGAVTAYLARHGLNNAVALAPGLANERWQGLAVDVGGALPHHQVAVTRAFAAVAASGSLVFLAGPDHPPRSGFLPEHHLVVLSKRRLLGRLEQLWPLLDGQPGEAVHLVGGPSSTADIGGHLLYGAHGPRAVHVLLVEDRN
ncbi:LUD domain-containing protein [Metapseudomonas resinovorans]|uniref:LUD domain-containing protein n=1 Tax=Metapseudomonas resinovorans NBRC 106553 TaxID=1245471 RepID=S6AIG1_METRE|nr:LUD domain-containing protein [Pseudomonas resinovorans]BAN48165.1 hypothetical protein PCA10_24330 [Pseudomonas resinovorans NBRC 106553]